MPEIAPVITVGDLDGTNGYTFLGDTGDEAGTSGGGMVDVNGDGLLDLVIGARYANSTTGSTYVVFGGTSNFAALDAADGVVDGRILLSNLDGSNGFQWNGEETNSRFGFASTGVGDVDGDGFDDVLTGAPRNGPSFNEGAAYLLFGASSFTANVSSNFDGYDGYVFRAAGPNANDQAGFSVSGLGDIDGDGFADFIIGARYADPSSQGTNSNEGAAYVVLGGRANLQALDAADGLVDGEIDLGNVGSQQGFEILPIGTPNTGLGRSVSGGGDINGDGYEDIIVGADEFGSDVGAAFIVFGHPAIGDLSRLDVTAVSGLPGARISGTDEFGNFGASVDILGDINGDGFADIAIGAPQEGAEGAAYVIFGKSAWGRELNVADLDGSNGFRLAGVRSTDQTGWSVFGVGDVNGDGFDDVAISGISFDTIGSNNRGALFVIFGKAGGFDAEIDLGALDGNDGFRIDGEASSTSSQFFGYNEFTAIGDINGDGFDDIYAGSVRNDGNGTESGAGYIIYGRMAEGDVTRVGTDLSQTQNGGMGDDTILGFGGDDVLIGHGGNDDLDAGSGDDILRGGAGDDLLDGGSGFDIASYVDVGAAVSVYLDTRNSIEQTSSVGRDTLVSIEGIVGSRFDDALLGDAGNNYINGDAGADRISGGDGDDTLDGSWGADLIYGGNGNDTISGSSSNDVIFGQDGDDLLNGDRGVDNIRGGRGADTINGGDENDRLYGEDGADRISGGIGEDYILAGSGDDLVNGGFGDDFIRGEDGDDNLSGSLGDDSIGGGNGNDRVRGGGGNDILAGNAGFDTFVFDEALGAGNVDFVTDFAVGQDTIELDLGIFTALSGGSLAASAFHIGSAATSSSHRIIYDSTTGNLFYDADGSGLGGHVQFARLGTGLALSASDFDLASAQEPLAASGKLPIIEALPEMLVADAFML